MPTRIGRTATLVAGALLTVTVATLAWNSSIRVPQGMVAACGGGRLYAVGWHLKPPWLRARLTPLSGRLDAIDVDRRSDDGAVVRIRLSCNYEIVPDTLQRHAVALHRSGLSDVVAGAVRAALDPTPLAALRPGGADAAGGRAPLPPQAREAVARAMREIGVEPLDLRAAIGPADAFLPGVDPGSGPSAASGEPDAPGSMPRRDPTAIRLVLIGLDGADWDIIDPLVRAGRLPYLARLMESGVRAPLRSYDPMISPLLWTTMVTGVGPDRHGVADFRAIDAASGRRIPISSRFRRVKALWNILSDAGIETAFVAWWASYPAEPVRGVQVSNLVAFEALRPRPEGVPPPASLTHPPDYFERIRPSLMTAADLTYEDVQPILHIDRTEFEAARREVLSRPPGETAEQIRRLAQQPVPLALSILAGSRNYATIAADLAARRPDLTAVYFEGIDMMGHRFQHCMPPRSGLCAEDDFARFKDAVTSFYQRQDAWIGEIVRAAGTETTVMVVSDHGFRTGTGRPVDQYPYTTEQPVEWHDQEGVFLLTGPGARRGTRLAERVTLFDITPTILHLLGMPTAEDMPGRVVLSALDPGFIDDHPVRSVRSYETLGPPRSPVASAEQDGGSIRETQEELLANLQALGYLGGEPGASVPATAEGGDADTQVFYHRNLATYFLKRNEYARAAEQLLLANERQRLPKNYQMLSEAYMGMGRREEAIATLQEGLNTLETADPEPVLWMVQMRLASAGGRAAALQDVRRYAARTAGNPGLDDAIGGLLKEDGGDAEEAAELYRRSLAADPLRVLVAQRLYVLEPPARRAAVLEPALSRALEKDPRIDEYHNLLGAILAERGRAGEALQSFRRAADLDPDNPRFAANLGGALARLERWAQAALAYEKAAVLAPSPATSMKLGSVYRRLGRPGDAFTAFERARALGNNGPAPALGMALARAEMNRLPEALATLREGLALHPDDPQLRSLYAELVQRTR